MAQGDRVGGQGYIVSNDKFKDEIEMDCDVGGTKTLGSWLTGGGKITFSFVPGDGEVGEELEFTGNATHPIVAQINAMRGSPTATGGGLGANQQMIGIPGEMTQAQTNNVY